MSEKVKKNNGFVYSKKHSLFHALGIDIIKIIANCIPIIFATLIVFIPYFDVDDNKPLVFFLLYTICSIGQIILILISVGIHYLTKVKAGLRQRYLPISEEDLRMNNITSISEYWKYMENILEVSGFVLPIMNNNSYNECEMIYQTYILEKSADFSFHSKMREIEQNNKLYSDFFDYVLDTYIPFFFQFFFRII